ncbi:MAG: hypothetical protein R2820_03660 [Cyclobacteriaceae bacterium]
MFAFPFSAQGWCSHQPIVWFPFVALRDFFVSLCGIAKHHPDTTVADYLARGANQDMPVSLLLLPRAREELTGVG